MTRPQLVKTLSKEAQMGTGRTPLQPKVTIVILNWNNAPDTLECLASVAELCYDNYGVLVVDNGSTDGSVAAIRDQYPGVTILENAENLGYAEGNNAGIRYAMQSGAELVLILNNDTLVAPTMLAELVRAIESSPEVGMVGPTVYCTDPADWLFAAGGLVLWKRGALCHRGMFQPAGPYTKAESPEPVDFIVGCGVLVRRQLIEAAGVLNPLYYLNYEDVEWGIRAHRHGFKVLYVPQAIMWHKVSATLGLASPANTYYMTRNALLFFWKNTPAHLRWSPVLRIVLRTLRTIGAWALRPQYREPIFRRKRTANQFALRDFFLGRFGEMGPDVARVCYGG
jgi:GT2 family glycosyltransferase